MQKKTPEERFMEKVRKDPVTGCWLWTAGVFYSGYAQFRFEGKTWKAHRWAYGTFVGDPGDLCVCHTCDVRHCVNPSHLWLGTNGENIHDAKAKGRLATGERNGSCSHPEQLKRGESNGRAKLNWAIVRQIRDQYAAGDVSLGQLGVQYGVSKPTISAVVKRETWAE